MQFRYADSGPRDHRLDLLRGFALFAMAVNHLGFENSVYHWVTGRSVFLINAAEGFFFISGMTLGFIAARDTVWHGVRRLLRRTWIVYLTTVGIAAGFAALAVTTSLTMWDDAEGIAERGAGRFLAGVLTLTEAFHGSDVLVTYVVYLGVAAGALWLLHAGRGWVVAALLAAVYAASQLAPEAVSLPFASFRSLAANTPVFFGGLLIGFYRRPLATWWESNSSRWVRNLFDGVTVAAAVGLLFLYATDYALWPWLGGHLQDTIGLREESMPLLQLSIVFLHLRAFWMLADRVWVPITRAAGWLLLPLGRASLFTYTAHLVGIVVIFNLPGVSEESGVVGATLIVTLYVALIYVAVQLRSVTRKWVAEQPPVTRGLAARLPATGAAVLVLALGLTAPVWSVVGPSEEELESDQLEMTALAEYLETEGIEYELFEDEGHLDVEIDWEDQRSVNVFEEFWERLEEGDIQLEEL